MLFQFLLIEVKLLGFYCVLLCDARIRHVKKLMEMKKNLHLSTKQMKNGRMNEKNI